MFFIKQGAQESIKALTETLIAYIQVPQVDPQIVGRNIGFLIRVDRDGVYVICMGIGVYFTWHSCDYVILLDHAW